jgi:hypothetical protein
MKDKDKVVAHQGSVGYLSAAQQQVVVGWLQSKLAWTLGELQVHLEEHYKVVYRSLQSYYDLFAAAKVSWKKIQKRNPKEDPALVEKKQEITAWLESERSAIAKGDLVVLFEDECHLLWEMEGKPLRRPNLS